jgi:uncharacterized protein (DUF305 family)
MPMSRRALGGGLAGVAIAAVGLWVFRAASPGAEAPLWCGSSGFHGESQVAMERMMVGMRVTPAGDADREFAAMMIPHHQGAIEMAQAELRYGKNEQLRRIAQGIVVEQLQEISALQRALEPSP